MPLSTARVVFYDPRTRVAEVEVYLQKDGEVVHTHTVRYGGVNDRQCSLHGKSCRITEDEARAASRALAVTHASRVRIERPGEIH